jgi:hypothetical protein
MLQVNPFFRISVQEALEHPVFEKERKSAKVLPEPTSVDIDFVEECELKTEALRAAFLKIADSVRSDQSFRQ